MFLAIPTAIFHALPRPCSILHALLHVILTHVHAPCSPNTMIHATIKVILHATLTAMLHAIVTAILHAITTAMLHAILTVMLHAL